MVSLQVIAAFVCRNHGIAVTMVLAAMVIVVVVLLVMLVLSRCSLILY